MVRQVLELTDTEREAGRIASYSVSGTSIEDIFLNLMHSGPQVDDLEKSRSSSPSLPVLHSTSTTVDLTNGRRRSPLSQAFTIFHKRALIARRSWLTPVLAVLVAVAGSCVPTFFLSDRAQTCIATFRNSTIVPVYLPYSPEGPIGEIFVGARVLETPPGLISTLGPTTQSVQVQNITDNSTFVDTIRQDFLNLPIGGISADLQNGSTLVAWEATAPGLTGVILLNLASNILYTNALNTSGKADGIPHLITANYESFPEVNAGTLVALKWVAFFGAAMVGD